jgi:hypothetical protein
VQFGEATDSASLRRTRLAPAVAAAISHASGAWADLKERLLVGASGAWLRLQGAHRPGRVVVLVDAAGPALSPRAGRPRAAPRRRRRATTTSSPPCPLLPTPTHRGARWEPSRERSRPRWSTATTPGASCHRVRHLRQPMQSVAFLGEHHRRRAPGDPVLARVGTLAVHGARTLEVGEGAVAGAQVVVRRDEVGLSRSGPSPPSRPCSPDSRARTP